MESQQLKEKICCKLGECAGDVQAPMISQGCRDSFCNILTAYLKGEKPGKLDQSCPDSIKDLFCILQKITEFRQSLKAGDKLDVATSILEFLKSLSSDKCFTKLVKFKNAEGFRRAVDSLLFAMRAFAKIDDFCINNKEDAKDVLHKVADQLKGAGARDDIVLAIRKAANDPRVQIALVALAMVVVRRGKRIKQCKNPRPVKPKPGGRPRPGSGGTNASAKKCGLFGKIFGSKPKYKTQLAGNTGKKRTTLMQVRLTRKRIQGGQEPTVDPPGFPTGVNPQFGAVKVARGHILAKELGGKANAANVHNLVPICQQTTNISMATFAENKVAKIVEQGYTVDYEVKLTYWKKNPHIPKTIKIRAKGWKRGVDDCWTLKTVTINQQLDLSKCPSSRN
ncbi:MAG: hypothetical protein Tsb009_35400 [Planctomycetaceae bacterium]